MAFNLKIVLNKTVYWRFLRATAISFLPAISICTCHF